MDQSQVTPATEAAEMPVVDWTRFTAFSVYRSEIYAKHIPASHSNYAEMVKVELALVNGFAQHMTTVHGLTQHEVFLVWENWMGMYRRSEVQRLLHRIEAREKDPERGRHG